MRAWKYVLLFLALIATLSWLAVLTRPSSNLRIIACDVGQGDAILVTKGTSQMLIDGGPGKRVTSCLSRYMPFWDRTVDVVILTHPDADHSTGLVEVFRDYNVGNFVYNGDSHDTEVYKTLLSEVSRSNTKVYKTKKGERLVYGKLYFDILHPPSPPASEGQARSKTNDLSIVMKMTFKDFDALFTGDIEDAISDQIADSAVVNNLEYLKVPHHGSKNGLSQKLLDEVSPQIAVISLGKNSFGHPHEEVLSMLSNSETKLLRTDKLGDIVIETDGNSFWYNTTRHL